MKTTCIINQINSGKQELPVFDCIRSSLPESTNPVRSMPSVFHRIKRVCFPLGIPWLAFLSFGRLDRSYLSFVMLVVSLLSWSANTYASTHAPALQISLSSTTNQTDWFAPAAATTQDVSVNSNGNWTVTEQIGWLSVTPRNVPGNRTWTLSVGEYNGTAPRSGIVKFRLEAVMNPKMSMVEGEQRNPKRLPK
jgi:hypothetical protein